MQNDIFNLIVGCTGFLTMIIAICSYTIAHLISGESKKIIDALKK